VALKVEPFVGRGAEMAGLVVSGFVVMVFAVAYTITFGVVELKLVNITA